MRIAYLADPNSVHARRWMAWFARAGHEVHLLVRSGLPIEPGLDPKISVHHYPQFRPWRLPWVSALQGGRALRAALREVAPDVVHAHYLVNYGWQARLAGVRPYVVTPWGSDLFVAPRRSIRVRLLNRRALRGADLVTVNSAYMAAAVVAAGAAVRRVMQISFGVDTSEFAPGPADPAILDRLGLRGQRYLLSLRALQPLYRHDVVLRALAQLPADLQLVMGLRNSAPAHVEALRSLMTEQGITNRVLLCEDFTDPELHGLLRGAAASISVPEHDGLPATVLEAMATACPPVVSDLPPLRALLSGAPQNLIVPAGDARALAERVRAILDLDPEERTGLVRWLRETAVESDRDANMRRMERLYYTLSGDSAGDAA